MRASALGFKQIFVRYEMFNVEFECIIGPKKNVGKYVAFKLRDAGNQSTYEVGDHRAKFYYGDSYLPIIWLPRFPKSPEDYELLTHEVGHAVTWMLGDRGVPINYANDETFCYALGHGVRTILEARRAR